MSNCIGGRRREAVDGTVIEEETRASLATTYRRFAEVECHDYSPPGHVGTPTS
jgi:hypothetical protein